MARMMYGMEHKEGFILVEILLGVALFATLITAAFLIMFLGESASIHSGDRFRAAFLAERALDTARSLREEEFLQLTQGTHGVDIGPEGTWVLSGSEFQTDDGYTVRLAITRLASDWASLQADVRWDHGTVGEGIVTLHAEITDWRAPVGEAWDPSPPPP
ncbi:hypothetical protein A3D11_01795 [Candidatus Peribacteria bacterium RIFCSPHIGHO2_02_FULL_49_16]|nr:MAG: hypothetical protein A2880_00905 [Candidatus Peribacteria bacterium RIFCSPHIGHO2_01_FULL_49_38]OGJ58649.1 MAG: hypothetical protein A3D11_01795 [Candidatus Peribacteria bacterium RIFCSPHIGHO2_02_FULL_49_16]